MNQQPILNEHNKQKHPPIDIQHIIYRLLRYYIKAIDYDKNNEYGQ